MKRVGCLQQSSDLAECVRLGDIAAVLLREGAQMSCARNVFSRTECVATWYIPYQLYEAGERPAKVAYIAQCATVAIDAFGGD